MYNPQKMNYVNPNIEYLFNNEIIEYDMREAGFTIIRQFNMLSPQEIKELGILEKEDRTIAIGKIRRRDRDFSNLLTEKFAEIRTQFVSANSLTDANIISVKNDAIYTIGECKKVKFGRIEFMRKNEYSSYIRFVNNMNIEIYYSPTGIDVKGIGEGGLNRHRLYLLDFISKVISRIENKDQSLKRFLMSFLDKYKLGQLDDEYYLEFSNLSNDNNAMYNYQKLLIPLIQMTIKELR